MTRIIPNSDRIQFCHSLPVAGRVSVNILRNGDLLVLDDTRSIIASGVMTYGFVECRMQRVLHYTFDTCPNGEPCRGCGTYAGFTQPDDIFEDGEHKGKLVVCLYPIMECVQCGHREWCD